MPFLPTLEAHTGVTDGAGKFAHFSINTLHLSRTADLCAAPNINHFIYEVVFERKNFVM